MDPVATCFISAASLAMRLFAAAASSLFLVATSAASCFLSADSLATCLFLVAVSAFFLAEASAADRFLSAASLAARLARRPFPCQAPRH